MNLDAALTHAAGALNARAATTPPDMVVELRADALALLLSHVTRPDTRPLGDIARDLWARGGGNESVAA